MTLFSPWPYNHWILHAYTSARKNGNVNLIISAPHGGNIVPSDIPDRTAGCFNSTNNVCIWKHNCGDSDSKQCATTTVRDVMSDDFAKNVAKQLKTKYGLSPYMVIGQWNRKKVDFNREQNEGTMNNLEGIHGHQSYHSFILRAIAKIKGQFGRGLLIDVHGHAAGNYSMIGYLLTGDDLNADQLVKQTSIEELIHASCSKNRNECIRGDKSFGFLLEANNLGIAYPSSNHPKPGDKKFFSGGYITRQYISDMNAIQTELPNYMRTGPERNDFAS
ncbi:unnamed protein product, partial [Didymodactylos carnosus]